MIKIDVPTGFKEETKYILKVIFEEFLGVPYSLSLSDGKYFVISMNNNQCKISVKGMFQAVNPWSNEEKIKPVPLYMAKTPILSGRDDLSSIEIPLCGIDTGNPLLEINKEQICLNFDLFGSAFYFLSRMEEYVSTERDCHGRFPATASHGYKNNYLHRPVVNEYIEILWWCMKKLWPRLERKQRSFAMKLTHDVDSPFENVFKPLWACVRSLGADIIKRHDLTRAIDRTLRWIDVKKGHVERDPFYTFKLIMDIGESVGSKDAFYFIPLNKVHFDGDYDIKHPKIKNIITFIHNRGHEIGFHGSYETYRDSMLTQEECATLQEVCASLGIEQPVWGGRQHYLRWEASTTWRNYTEAGLNYDTTLSYADYAGFRCGTCYPFQVYDLEKRKPLNLWEHPLTTMECSLFDERYMNLPYDEAFDYAEKLKNTCKKYNGEFVLLWHNSHFVLPEEIEFYKELVMW